MAPLNILVVSSEATPFAKTGGLADVSSALTRFLGRDGHDVRLVMPLHRCVREGDFGLEPLDLAPFQVELGARSFPVRVFTAPLPKSDRRVLFLDCPELFDRPSIYTSGPDEHLRFALLSAGALRLCQELAWSPDICHVNDWHAALLPLYLRWRFSWDRLFARTKTVLTIHNIAYQGVFPAEIAPELGFDADRHLFHNGDLEGGVINYLKTGILYADAITTVSRTYAREIQTSAFGAGLEDLLRERSAVLFGIVNGIDPDEWNPATDPHLAANYDAEHLEGKLVNKRALLDDFDLPFDPAAPVFGIVSRMTAQKGFDLLKDILPVLLREEDMRLVVIGTGERSYEDYFQWLRDTFPRKAAVYRGYQERIAHRIEAGADAFLMPSLFEPCGLNQMYSQRYGTLPIVRRVGGLADTVLDYDPVTGEGTGFVFNDFTSDGLLWAMRKALGLWRDSYAWRRVMLQAMSRDFSWDRQGREYVDLYQRLLS